MSAVAYELTAADMQTKAMFALIARVLGQRLKQRGIVALAVNPGAVRHETLARL